MQHLPVGGVADLSGVHDPGAREFEDAFLNDDMDEVEGTLREQVELQWWQFAHLASIVAAGANFYRPAHGLSIFEV